MPTPTSIAFITSLPQYGGGEKWMVQAATAMSSRGHKVCVIGRSEAETLRRAEQAGLKVIPMRMGGWLDPFTLWTMRQIFLREKVSVAGVNLDKEIRLAAFASRGIPDFHIVPRRGSPDPIKDNWHYRFVYQNMVDRLIINCENLVKKVCDTAPWFDQNKVRIIYNGVNTERLLETTAQGQIRSKLNIPADRTVVCLVGEVGWRKGQEILLQAAKTLKTDFPETSYLIVGTGNGLEELRTQSRHLGLDDGTVQFLGFRNDVPEIMRASDILVLPSRREGLPNTLLEGMALGLPVVATQVDGIPELVLNRETGLLVEPDDVPAFKNALATLLTDTNLGEVYGSAGQRRIKEQFNEEMMFEQIEDCLINW